MSAAIPRVRAVAVLPLDFVGKLRILRTMHGDLSSRAGFRGGRYLDFRGS